MKIIESKSYKVALLPGNIPSPQEQWDLLEGMAKKIMEIYNENDLGAKGVKCWVQKRDPSKSLFDISISKVNEAGGENATELVSNGSFEQSKRTLTDIYMSAVARLLAGGMGKTEPPGPAGPAGSLDDQGSGNFN